MRNWSRGPATSRRTCRGRSRRPTRPAGSWACPLGHDHAKVGRISWNAPKVCAGASSSSPGVDVLFAGSFYYLPSPETGTAIAADLLRPGGRVIILSPATRLLALFVRVYRPEEYRQFMEGAGLRLLRYERLNWAACLVIAERPRS